MIYQEKRGKEERENGEEVRKFDREEVECWKIWNRFLQFYKFYREKA